MADFLDGDKAALDPYLDNNQELKRMPKCSNRYKKGRNGNFDKNVKKLKKACFRNSSKQV